MKIDWSKAPDWSTKHGFVSPEMHAVWLNEHKYRYVDERQCGRSFSLTNGEGFTIDQVMGISLRPAVSEWSGKGTPPAGTICEGQAKNGGHWRKYKIIAVTTHYAIVSDKECEETAILHIYWEFRPIRTPEQIAAEEMEVGVSEMADIINQTSAFDHNKSDLEALWKAGYRKFEIVDGAEDDAK